MRTNTPRLPELKEHELNEEQLAYAKPLWDRGIKTGVLGSLVRHVRASMAFRDWSRYTMGGQNKLLDREREVVAMRTAFNIKAGYVWSRHIPYGTDAGLTPEEMEALKKPISAHDWSAADISLIRAADALTSDFFMPDDVWEALRTHFDEEQCIDVIFCCGHFVMLGMYLNTSGVPIDSDVVSDPDLVKLG